MKKRARHLCLKFLLHIYVKFYLIENFEVRCSYISLILLTYLLSPVQVSGGPQVSSKGSPNRSVLSQRHNVVIVQVLLLCLMGHRSSPGVS